MFYPVQSQLHLDFQPAMREGLKTPTNILLNLRGEGSGGGLGAQPLNQPL